jgi:hypothetical protein
LCLASFIFSCDPYGAESRDDPQTEWGLARKWRPKSNYDARSRGIQAAQGASFSANPLNVYDRGPGESLEAAHSG